jgi:hypothetical protein
MNRSTSVLAAALASLVLGPTATAQSFARTPVTEMKPLLIQAIEQGAAHGVLTGEAATYVRQKFDSSAPIEIDVRALHALPQAGCRRLEVTTRQKDVLEKGTRGDQALTYQVSYCRDGRFPEQR